MLFDAVRVKPIDPEQRMIFAISDTVSPVFVGHLNDPAQTQCSQGCIIESGRRLNVCHANPRDRSFKSLDLANERYQISIEFVGHRCKQAMRLSVIFNEL